MKPVTFYVHLRNHTRLRKILTLKYLKSYEQWRNFDRKRKYLKRNFGTVLKRNFTKKVDEMYTLDTTVGEADLSRKRKGGKIKEGTYDVQFVHSPTKGSTVGFIGVP
jgi:hypothetical protein